MAPMPKEARNIQGEWTNRPNCGERLMDATIEKLTGFKLLEQTIGVRIDVRDCIVDFVRTWSD